jgi:WD40 repeat protein
MAREISTIATPARAESFVLAASGRLAAAVCADHKLRVWSLPGAELRQTMSLSETQNDLTSMSPDGHWLVTGDHHGDGMVWDASAGREYCELRLNPYPATAGFSRDSRYLAVAPMGEPVQVYEMASRRMLFETARVVGGANAIAFSRDGALLATVDGDTLVRIYDARSGKLVASNADSLMEPLTVEFTADGKYAIAGGGDKVIAFIDTATGKMARKMDRTAQPAVMLRASPNGKSLAAAYMKAENMLQPAPIVLMDAATSHKISEWLPPSVPIGGDWVEDGRLLIATATNEAIHVWQV